MAQNHVFIGKIVILRALLFLQLLKFKKQKCAWNFDFSPKKWIFCRFDYFFEIFHTKKKPLLYSSSVPMYTALVKSPFLKVNIAEISRTLASPPPTGKNPQKAAFFS